MKVLQIGSMSSKTIVKIKSKVNNCINIVRVSQRKQWVHNIPLQIKRSVDKLFMLHQMFREQKNITEII